jgi:hypothetical protein
MELAGSLINIGKLCATAIEKFLGGLRDTGVRARRISIFSKATGLNTYDVKAVSPARKVAPIEETLRSIADGDLRSR